MAELQDHAALLFADQGEAGEHDQQDEGQRDPTQRVASAVEQAAQALEPAVETATALLPLPRGFQGLGFDLSPFESLPPPGLPLPGVFQAMPTPR